MRTLLAPALLLLPLASSAQAPGPAAYDAGRYEEAAAAFAAEAAAAPERPEAWYNLGGALLKAGRLGRAVAAYERAFTLAPRDADIRDNLDFALRRAGESLAPEGVPPLAFLALTLLSERELAGLHWLAAWACLLSLAALLRPAARPGSRRAAAAAAAAWLFFGLWWVARRAAFPAEGRAAIAVPRAELRNGPGGSFGVGFTAPEGRRARILSEQGSWVEIGLLKEGARGWVRAADIERLGSGGAL